MKRKAPAEIGWGFCWFWGCVRLMSACGLAVVLGQIRFKKEAGINL